MRVTWEERDIYSGRVVIDTGGEPYLIAYEGSKHSNLTLVSLLDGRIGARFTKADDGTSATKNMAAALTVGGFTPPEGVPRRGERMNYAIAATWLAESQSAVVGRFTMIADKNDG